MKKQMYGFTNVQQIQKKELLGYYKMYSSAECCHLYADKDIQNQN